MSELHPALLPQGLKDLLPDEAEQEALAIHGFMKVFASFGYARVKPPLVEFEECLLAPGPGQALASDIFRLMDPVSRRMMGVRADMTAQIARIAGSRLKEEKRPLRLSYAADVLRVNGSQLRPERQFCQVGCELVGASTYKDDVEVALLALLGLKKAGVKNLSIDLTIPSLIDAVYEDHKTRESEQEILNHLLQKRERDALEQQEGKTAALFVELLDISGPVPEAITKLVKLKLPKTAKTNVQSLKQVYQELVAALETYGLCDVNMTIDLIERRGFEYQTGVSFTLFSSEARGELGRGGRYNIRYNDIQESATGFTFYMDTILRVIAKTNDQKEMVVDKNCSWEEIKNWQQDGWNVSRGGEKRK